MLSQDGGGESQEGLEVDGDEVGEGILEIRWSLPVLERQSIVSDELDDAFMGSRDSSSTGLPLILLSIYLLVMGIDATAEIRVTLYEEDRVGWMFLYVGGGNVEAGDAGAGDEEVIHSTKRV